MVGMGGDTSSRCARGTTSGDRSNYVSVHSSWVDRSELPPRRFVTFICTWRNAVRGVGWPSDFFRSRVCAGGGPLLDQFGGRLAAVPALAVPQNDTMGLIRRTPAGSCQLLMFGGIGTPRYGPPDADPRVRPPLTIDVCSGVEAAGVPDSAA